MITATATAAALHTNTWFIPVIIGAAAADSINPCAFSILFLSISFMFSLGRDRRSILKAGALYIAGIALVYMMIGVGILRVLSLFSVPNVLGKVGALILVGYSLVSLANELFPSFPIKLKIPADTHGVLARVIRVATMPAAFLLGALVGLFEFPCTGGPYLFVLSLIHDQKTFWAGFGYLLVYNFIFVAPLIVILALSTTKKALDKAERLRRLESKKGRLAFDLVLLGVGLALFIGL